MNTAQIELSNHTMRLFNFLFTYILLIIILLTYSNGSEETNIDVDEKSEENPEDSSHNHPYGRPVGILKFDTDGKFIVDNDTLNDMFLHPDVKDRKIVAVSIIGAFRKGKSFLMDYVLRFMYANYESIANPNNTFSNKENWMGEPDEPLKGFSWRGGTKRDTTGVIMWSDIFLAESKAGPLAIVLMDTQGLFDPKTTQTHNSRIFALGTLASSIQIFNLNDVILETQLEYLQLATEFSQFAMKKHKEGKKRAKNFKPFQRLIFLMRDWQNNQEFNYGEVGGASYLTTVLAIQENQPESLKNVRNYIKSSFEKLDCFLLPHPGETVTTDPEYEGQRSGLAPEFEEQLQRFIEYILKPDRLIAKKILNKETTSADFAEYLKAYFIAFESDDIPQVETLHTITIRKQYEILIADAMNEFKSELKEPNYNSDTFLEDMESNGNFSMTKALKSFKQKRKLGSQEDERNYGRKLAEMIEVHLTEWKLQHVRAYNEQKRVEEEARKKIEEAERLANENLENQRKRDEEEKERQRLHYEEETRKLNETLQAIKTNSEQEVKSIRAEYEAHKARTEQENEKIFNELKKQNEEMRRKVLETQTRMQEEILKMETRMAEKQREMEKLIAGRTELKLEELKMRSEQKRIELEQQFKIEELRQKAEIEQKELDRKTRIEEALIRENAEKERKLELQKLIFSMKEDQRRMQEMMLASIRSG